MSGNKVVVNKRVDINIFAAQFGVLEIQALIQKGFVVDSTQPIRKRGNHIFVELIGTESSEADNTEEVTKVVFDTAGDVGVSSNVEATKEEVAKPTEVVKETIVKPAAKKTTKAKEVKDA